MHNIVYEIKKKSNVLFFLRGSNASCLTTFEEFELFIKFIDVEMPIDFSREIMVNFIHDIFKEIKELDIYQVRVLKDLNIII